MEMKIIGLHFIYINKRLDIWLVFDVISLRKWIKMFWTVHLTECATNGGHHVLPQQ